MRDYRHAISEHVVVYDGGMGATLEQFELTSEDYGGLQGKCHEALVLNRPDVIEGVHTSMLDAGAQVLETDTFQASRLKLSEWGLEDHTLEINQRAAEIARKAAGEARFVAGSIGPTGFLPASDDPSLGQIRFRELVEVFREQATGLVKGGVDLIIIETAQDILEVKAAIFGTREAFKELDRSVPIQTSVSLLPQGGKMLLGTDISSMIAATPLVQDPRPTLVGERVNSQGSRKAKELLLADDYDGLTVVAEDQVNGGAHVLDVCVALTERQDEDEQMRQVVKRISLTQPAPIQVDSTEPDVIETALEQIPGRAIVNSINLEAGRDKLDRVVPVAKAHGAALIALTIDEQGMAKTAERKVEVARRITQLCCEEHGLDPEVLIFDCLTFTLTTGDDEWKPSAIETIEGIRRIKAEIPGVKTSLGVSK